MSSFLASQVQSAVRVHSLSTQVDAHDDAKTTRLMSALDTRLPCARVCVCVCVCVCACVQCVVHNASMQLAAGYIIFLRLRTTLCSPLSPPTDTQSIFQLGNLF